MKLFDMKMQGHEPKHDVCGCPLLDHTLDVPDKKVIDRMLMRINQKIKHQAKGLETSKNDDDEEEKGKSLNQKITRMKKKGKKRKRPKVRDAVLDN